MSPPADERMEQCVFTRAADPKGDTATAEKVRARPAHVPRLTAYREPSLPGPAGPRRRRARERCGRSGFVEKGSLPVRADNATIDRHRVCLNAQARLRCAESSGGTPAAGCLIENQPV